MSISKLKIILLSFIFILMLGCLKQKSTMLDINSTNYLLVHRGDATTEKIISATKVFFSSKLTPFKMKYEVFPPVNSEYISKKDTILPEIKDIASKLDSNSTLVYFYFGHGLDNGDWIVQTDHANCPTISDNEDVIPDDCKIQPSELLENIKEGRTKDGKIIPFKRFILISNSCYSGMFMLRLQESIKKETEKLFEEGIYIAAASADKKAFTTTDWTIIFPIFSFLRAQQILSCQKTSTSYQTTYDTKIKSFLIDHSYNMEPIQSTFKVISLEDLVKSQNFNEKNPTFNDLDLILKKLVDNSNKIRKELVEGNSLDISFNISFSNNSLRNASIFPTIDNCN